MERQGVPIKVAVAGVAVVAVCVWWSFFTGAGSAPEPPEKPGAEVERLMATREPLFGHVRGQARSGRLRAERRVAARPHRSMLHHEKRHVITGSATTGQGDEDTDAQLEMTALTDGDPDERVAAIDELSVAWDEEDALPVLTAAARDHDASVRTAALEALADMSDTRAAVDAAMGALHDPSPDVRVAALDILADSEDPRRFDELRAARLDPDEDVRFEAEYLLGSADDVDDDTTDDSE